MFLLWVTRRYLKTSGTDADDLSVDSLRLEIKTSKSEIATPAESFLTLVGCCIALLATSSTFFS